MEQIAAAAGVARQTVYAHYPSREALLDAVLERITAEVIAVLDALDLDTGPAPTALGRWVDASWGLLDRYPLLLNGSLPVGGQADEHERHMPIIERLVVLVLRGQASGEFDPDVPATWLVSAIIALGHAAGQEVGAGRMNAHDAGGAFRDSSLRLCVKP